MPAPPLMSTFLHLKFLKMYVDLVSEKRACQAIVLQFCHYTSLKLRYDNNKRALKSLYSTSKEMKPLCRNLIKSSTGRWDP